MKQLGLQPTKNSGAGWIEKADGQSDDIIAELKSSEAASISVKWADIAKLEEQAIVAGKIPIFVIQDLTNNEPYVIIRPENIQSVAKYLKTGKNDNAAYKNNDNVEKLSVDTVARKPRKIIGAPSQDTRNTLMYKKKEETAY